MLGFRLTNTAQTFPVLPLRDIVVFPHMIVPLFVGREKSVAALEKVMEDSFFRYSMSVIIDRALPDVRDGLKPVHRRILHSMNVNGNRSNAKFVKSARIVGDVMGKYHPHGDSDIYDSRVRLALPWALR